MQSCRLLKRLPPCAILFAALCFAGCSGSGISSTASTQATSTAPQSGASPIAPSTGGSPTTGTNAVALSSSSNGSNIFLTSGSALTVVLAFSGPAPANSFLVWQLIGTGADFAVASGTVSAAQGASDASFAIAANPTTGHQAARNYALSIAPIDASVISGTVTILLTVNDGLGGPVGAAISSRKSFDSAGNFYFADTGNNVIRMINAATGTIATVAGGAARGFGGNGAPATRSDLNGPNQIALDGSGNLYIADSGNNVIRRVDKISGTISTVAGNGQNGFAGDGGPATSAQINNPVGVAIDAAGNLYIADSGNARIRRVDAATNVITTAAGNGQIGSGGDGGPATSAQLGRPQGVAIDAAGNLYFADDEYAVIRRVDKIAGTISTVAGNHSNGFSGDGGPATSAQINDPVGVAIDAAGNLYIADCLNSRIRRVDATTHAITTVAGNGIAGFSGDGGLATSAQMQNPQGVAVDGAGNLYIGDANNQRIRKVNGATHIMTTVAGNGHSGYLGDGGLATSAQMQSPQGVAVDGAGNLYIADYSNSAVREVAASTGVISTVAAKSTLTAEGGPATSAVLNGPSNITLDASGNLYISDTVNSLVRRVDKTTGFITTVAGISVHGQWSTAHAGDGGPASSAPLNGPMGLVFDSLGNLFVADSGSGTIRRIDAATQIITTVAGDGSGCNANYGNGGPAWAASLCGPVDILIDGSGNLLIAESDGETHDIKKVDAATGLISIFAGDLSNGNISDFGDGALATGAIFTPTSLAMDPSGNIYIADANSDVSAKSPPQPELFRRSPALQTPTATAAMAGLPPPPSYTIHL